MQSWKRSFHVFKPTHIATRLVKQEHAPVKNPENEDLLACSHTGFASQIVSPSIQVGCWTRMTQFVEGRSVFHPGKSCAQNVDSPSLPEWTIIQTFPAPFTIFHYGHGFFFGILRYLWHLECYRQAGLKKLVKPSNLQTFGFFGFCHWKKLPCLGDSIRNQEVSLKFKPHVVSPVFYIVIQWGTSHALIGPLIDAVKQTHFCARKNQPNSRRL